MKKYKKLLINIMVIFIILFNLFIPNAYAGPLQDIMNRAEGFVNNGENGGNVINNDALKEGSNTLYNVLFELHHHTETAAASVLYALVECCGCITERCTDQAGLSIPRCALLSLLL